MLTAKLSSYSPDEVDLLIKALESTIVEITKSTNCKGKSDCNSKHVCYDISKMYDYLTLEEKYGYPHCKK